MKISIILGTRPEIIKMSYIIKELEKKDSNYFTLHTGQHYSYNLDKIFFKDLELPLPKYNLDVGSGSHAEETGKMVVGIEKILKKEKPDIILVQGDTNTVLAGALAASKIHIRIGHVEAGLRSYDRVMPEETNRVLTDHISDYLFAPTNSAKANLLNEGIEENKIFTTGNTVVDAVNQNLKIAEKKVKVLDKLDLKNRCYFLLTLHRQENVDVRSRLESIFEGLSSVYQEFDLPLIYPIHPRTKKRLGEFNLKIPEGVRLVDPVGYLEFLQLQGNAFLALTDSGGVQEEACILKVPCVTIRDSTERPETVDVGSNVLTGANSENILKSTKFMANKKRDWVNPFGNGKSGNLILDILQKEEKQ